MIKRCSDCAHCRGPENTGHFLQFTCQEVVEKDATGKLKGTPTPEARRYCLGDWWRPKRPVAYVARALIDFVFTEDASLPSLRWRRGLGS